MASALRDRKKARTRAAILAAAHGLFEQRGFEATTVEAIAQAAEIARRTFFRYFPTKEAVVFPDDARRLDAFRALLAQREAGESAFAALRRASVGMTAELERGRDEMLRQRRLVEASPALIAHERELDRRWEQAIAQALVAAGMAGRRARILAGASMGAIRATLAEWYASEGSADLTALGREALDLIERGFQSQPTHPRARRAVSIPEQGQDPETIFERMESYRDGDVPWRDGKTWGYVYDAGEAVAAVAKRAYMRFLSENALDPTVFPSLLRFENEILSIAAAHLRGDDQVVGNFTSGGTESILLAVKTARDWARIHKPDVELPEMILPVTAHAAHQKAAHYFNVRPVLVDVDPITFAADPEAVRAAIGPNTILLVGSAPSYAHGVVDPIPALGRLALEHGLLLHVDACIGGWLLPYFRRLGSEITDFDFKVPGVSSISMDLHKYAFCAKGASVLLWRDRDLRRHQIFSCATWTGYTVVNATMQSSKSGGPVAAAWAVLHFLGDEGYLGHARALRDASRRLIEGIDAIEGLRILGRPEMTLIAFASDEIDVFEVIDLMKDRGWYIQPQLAYGGSKENIHLSVAPSSVPHVEALLADLRRCVAAAREKPSSDLAATVSDMFSSVDVSQLTPEMFQNLLGMAGMTGVALPDRMAEINRVLNSLPAELAAGLVTQFINELYGPQGGTKG